MKVLVCGGRNFDDYAMVCRGTLWHVIRWD